MDKIILSSRGRMTLVQQSVTTCRTQSLSLRLSACVRACVRACVVVNKEKRRRRWHCSRDAALSRRAQTSSDKFGRVQTRRWRASENWQRCRCAG